MGSGASHKRNTAMTAATASSDKHLRGLLLEKTAEVQRLKSEIDR